MHDYELESAEMDILYKTFAKLLNVIKFASETLMKYYLPTFINIPSGNNAESLINYAKSRQVYNELGNTKGVGICDNNIGNIHMKM